MPTYPACREPAKQLDFELPFCNRRRAFCAGGQGKKSRLAIFWKLIA